MLGIERKALFILGKFSTMELYPSLLFNIFAWIIAV
jgi:hypothetical protein